MLITSLGHAGFLVEADGDMVVVDPWLAADGCVDGAWFQMPRNHHLIEPLKQRLAQARHVAVYVTHEHEDHFCRGTLMALKGLIHDAIIPDFEIKSLRDAISSTGIARTTEVSDGNTIAVGGMKVTIFVDEAGINRDSAVLISDGSGRTFLNFNDCKIFDRAAMIHDEIGRLDVFACQFSGATMHPACYDYPPEQYRRVNRQKRMAKFAGVRRAIETLQPRAFLPSAGPPAFLDPRLFHLNFEPDSVFAKSWEFAKYVRDAGMSVEVLELDPGETARVEVDIDVVRNARESVTAETLQEYLLDYQRHSFLGTALAVPPSVVDADAVLGALEKDLTAKVDAYAPFRDVLPVEQALYFSFEDAAELVRVDFSAGRVGRTDVIDRASFYRHHTALSRLAKVMRGEQTWSSYTATFRFRNSRAPDVYDSVISLMLFSDLTEFHFGLKRLADFKTRVERLVVRTISGESYEIHRYCPHQGADLKYARVEGSRLICPRHNWSFDLAASGVCPANGESICAKKV